MSREEEDRPPDGPDRVTDVIRIFLIYNDKCPLRNVLYVTRMTAVLRLPLWRRCHKRATGQLALQLRLIP
jgi:hypothetical protein